MEKLEKLKSVFSSIEVGRGDCKGSSFRADVLRCVKILKGLRKNGKKAIIIGNGGSASIAGHIATDLLKNCRIPALSFSDPSLITCLSNDLGYECVFEKPLEMLAGKGDLLIAISSSGESRNILNAVRRAKAKGCYVVTMSGFKKTNSLRKMGDINFYVPSWSYGDVEITHLAICHEIVDNIYEAKAHG